MLEGVPVEGGGLSDTEAVGTRNIDGLGYGGGVPGYLFGDAAGENVQSTKRP